MDDLATELEDRGDRVRFAVATADPVAGECLAHLGYGAAERAALVRAALAR